MSGSVGNVTFIQGATGMVARARVIPRNPRTPAQTVARDRLAAAGKAWMGMTLEQGMAWQNYAEAQQRATGGRTTGQLLFSALATRFLMVNPTGTIPLLPPNSPFPGDAVSFTAASEGQTIVVSASQSNAPDVVTEVLFQPLVSVHRRMYARHYRTAAVHAFVSGEPLALPAPGRVTAVAVRLIRASTGQAGELMEIGVVVLGG